MAISGISGGANYGMSRFQQINRQIDKLGQEKTAMYSDRAASYSRVSNFGTETKLGTSKFSKGLELTNSLGEQKTSQAMKNAKDIRDVSRIGTSKFQRGLETTNSLGSQKTSMYMDRARSYTEVSNFGNETKLGSSKFQQNLKKLDSMGMQNVSSAMSKARSFTEVSNFGNETKLGSSGFQKVNATIMNHAKQAYQASKSAPKAATLDIGA